MSPDTGRPVILSEVPFQRVLEIKGPQEHMAALRPIFDSTPQANRELSRFMGSRGEFANFTEEDFVPVAQDNFHKCEKFCLLARPKTRNQSLECVCLSGGRPL